jgi:hypothetical protein
MFFYTDTADAPWTVVKSNDKKRARLEAIRHILEQFDYDGKDAEVVGKSDEKIIGPSATLSEKTSVQSFTRLLGSPPQVRDRHAQVKKESAQQGDRDADHVVVVAVD